LLNLNKDQAIDALGMSVTHGTVMDGASHGQMPTSKSLLDGVQVMNAVVALLLAQRGVTGPHEVIEGTAGYAHAVAGSCNTDGLLSPIGKHKILESYTKLYNTVKCGQTAVHAALELVKEHKNNWHDMKSGLQRETQTTKPETAPRLVPRAATRPITVCATVWRLRWLTVS
jgi:2-methylcitrate dehydratase PrpD